MEKPKFNIYEILSPWNIAVITQALHIHKKLLKHDRSWNDIEEFLNQNITATLKRLNAKSIFRQCKECKSPMALYPVNNSSATQVDMISKSQWYCKNCGNAIFNKLTIEDEIKRVKEFNNGELKRDSNDGGGKDGKPPSSETTDGETVPTG